jgi:K+-sensing histidine kinase KdpD
MSGTPSTAAPVVHPEPDDTLAYAAAGPLLAIVLGIGLMPLREVVSASNLSFPFVILTIVVAAFGGRSAGVATAMVSALSMDFFLTRPYLSLSISSPHDIIAFVGLAACGLVAAALGSPGRIAALREARRSIDLFHASLLGLEGGGPADTALSRFLDSTCNALPVKALVVRDEHDRVVAASRGSQALQPIPDQIVAADLLLLAGAAVSLGRRYIPLPTEGTRLALRTGNRQVGWLDLWGDGVGASEASRRTLCDLARLWAALLARDQPHRTP